MTLRDFGERYGLALGVIAAVTIVLAVLPGNADRRVSTNSGIGQVTENDQGQTSQGQIQVPGGSVTGGPSSTAVLGGSGRIASSTGEASVIAGQGSCRADGRMKGISKYLPPCISFKGDNGGATARGVTRTQIKVVAYVGDRNAGVQAVLEGADLADPPEIVKRAYEALRIYNNQHHQTYGREVVLVEVKSSGLPEDDQAMKRDAVKIAEEIRPFAVIVGDPAAQIPPTLAAELAARGVICICTVSLSSQWYLERGPHIFGTLPVVNEYAAHTAEYVAKRLVGPGRTAKWAGDVRYQTRPRKFGLIYVEGVNGKVDPEGRRGRDIIVAEFARYGLSFAAEEGYLIEPGNNQNDVTAAIAKMRNEEVTTIIPLVDPIYPIFFTSEATRQGYFPEWFITGTGLSDTSAAGRLYDKAQWKNAFGISPLAIIPWSDVRRSTGYREFYHGAPGVRPGSCGPDQPCEGVLINIYRAYFSTLFRGIHMAGPKLTLETFAQGMFNYPQTGGLPAHPLVFLTREAPTEIKDFVEVFFAPDQRGYDERGQDGFGLVMKVDLGRRYRPGQWPTTDPKVFEMANTMAASDNPPGGGHPPHEEDGHSHTEKCVSC